MILLKMSECATCWRLPMVLWIKSKFFTMACWPAWSGLCLCCQLHFLSLLLAAISQRHRPIFFSSKCTRVFPSCSRAAFSYTSTTDLQQEMNHVSQLNAYIYVCVCMCVCIYVGICLYLNLNFTKQLLTVLWYHVARWCRIMAPQSCLHPNVFWPVEILKLKIHW